MNNGQFNTKIKIYKDGTTNITYCNHRCFQPFVTPERDLNKSVKEKTLEMLEQGCLRGAEGNVNTEFSVAMKKYTLSVSDYIDKRNEKLKHRPDNLKRAKDRVFDIVYQNEFKYFVTLTLNDENENINREEPQTLIQPLRIWLSHQVQRKGLKYLLIPELHKNGAVHCHLLINDVFKLVDSGTVIYNGRPHKVEYLKSKGVYPYGLKTVYNIPEWKYGFSTAIELSGEIARVAYYMTKYITKDLKKIFGKYYWSSRNIVRECETEYINTNYSEIPHKEYKTSFYDLEAGQMSFKYERHVIDLTNQDINAFADVSDVDFTQIEWC